MRATATAVGIGVYLAGYFISTSGLERSALAVGIIGSSGRLVKWKIPATNGLALFQVSVLAPPLPKVRAWRSNPFQQR